MSRSLTRPRHVLVSIALVAVLGATGVVASGAVSEVPEVAPFFVPAPRVGDRAAYVTEHTEMTYADGTSGRWMDQDVFTFAWERDQRGPNGTGVVQTMNTLRTRQLWEQQGVHWDMNRTYLLAVDGRVQGSALSGGQENQHDQPNVLVPALNSTSTSQWNWTFTVYVESGPEALRCGVRNALQGHLVDPADLSSFEPMPCFNGPHPQLEHRFVPRAIGHDEAGVRILELDVVEARQGGRTVATFWMQEGNPYPLRIRMGDADQPMSDSRLVVQQVGDRPIAAEADAEASPIAIGSAERPAWGVPDQGIDHPYPLSTAYQEALAHPDADALRAYLTAHPDAYVAQAAFVATSHRADHAGMQWSITWSDGPTAHRAWISRDTASDTVLGVPVPGSRKTSTSFGSQDDDRVYPLPSQVPATVPTAHSALAWYALVGDEPELPGYGIDIHCQASQDDACAGAAVQVEAGWARFTRRATDPMYQDYEDRTEADKVILSTDRFLGRYTTESHWDTEVTGPVKAPEDDPATAEDVVPLAATLGAWSWPSPSEAAGIAGASLLVGLLYWLWPLLKAGPAALFSRIDKHELLDHPLRAGIHQAIESRPGIHYQELLRTTGHANGTLDHHLQTLVRGGLVKAMKGPGYTCYFDASVGHARMKAAPALKSEGARKVLAAIQDMPGVAPRDVALKAGLSPQTVHYHLHRLREAGLVEEERDGRKVALKAT